MCAHSYSCICTHCWFCFSGQLCRINMPSRSLAPRRDWECPQLSGTMPCLGTWVMEPDKQTWIPVLAPLISSGIMGPSLYLWAFFFSSLKCSFSAVVHTKYLIQYLAIINSGFKNEYEFKYKTLSNSTLFANMFFLGVSCPGWRREGSQSPTLLTWLTAARDGTPGFLGSLCETHWQRL